jgi:hypothetical protein
VRVSTNLSCTLGKLPTAISRVQQPIETLFAWIDDKTVIECVGKVRSYNDLLVHVFGKLAAALFFGIICDLALKFTFLSHL